MREHQWKVEDNGLHHGVPCLHLGLLKEIVGNNSEDLWVTPKWWLATVPFNKLTHFLKEQIFLLWGEMMSTYCNTGYLKGKFICQYMHVYVFNKIYNYTYTHSYWHIYLYVNNQKLNNQSLLLISAIFFHEWYPSNMGTMRVSCHYPLQQMLDTGVSYILKWLWKSLSGIHLIFCWGMNLNHFVESESGIKSSFWNLWGDNFSLLVFGYIVILLKWFFSRSR